MQKTSTENKRHVHREPLHELPARELFARDFLPLVVLDRELYRALFDAQQPPSCCSGMSGNQLRPFSLAGSLKRRFGHPRVKGAS